MPHEDAAEQRERSAERPDLESSTDRYARRFAGPVGEYFLDVQWQIVKRMLPAPSACRVLDVGGGHAQLAVPMVDAGYDVTVLGSDNSCIERLDRKIGKGRYQFIEGDLLALPLENDCFDVVLAFRLLPHLQHWRGFVDEICRVSRRSVVVDYPDLRSVNWLAGQMFAAKSMIEENTRKFRCFRRREIMASFQRNKVKNFELKAQFLLPMALHRLMKIAFLSRMIENVARTLGLTNMFGSPVIVRASF